MTVRIGKTALITGASSGIGATYADKLAARGYDLVLVARRTDRLEELRGRLAAHGVDIRIVTADLGTESGIAAVEQVLATDASIDLLINNAGIARIGATADIPPADILAMLQLNIVALTRLARAALPGFIARNSGTIVNIASAVALHSLPITSIYSGTKAYVVLLSHGLQQELEGTRVRVQVVLPAAVATEIYNGVLPLEAIPADKVMSPGDMVEASLAGLDSGEAVTLPSVSDISLWERYDAAREALFNATQTGRPAPRYGV